MRRALTALATALLLLATPAQAARPRLFLSCPKGCHDDFLRQSLSWFDLVRHVADADWTLTIVPQAAASGGVRWSVRVQHSKVASDDVASTSLDAAPTAPAAEIRDKLLQQALRALHTAMAGTAHAEAFVLSLPQRDNETLGSVADPWDLWVLTPELNGEGEGGRARYWLEFFGGMTVRRISDQHKLRLRLHHGRLFSGARLEDGRFITGNIGRWDGSALYAKSVGRHMALGATAFATRGTWDNYAGHVHVGALAEANLFPYADNARRQLRLAWQAGGWWNRYFERTSLGKTAELRPYHAISLVAEWNEPWGSVQWVGQFNQFADKPSQNRLATGAVLGLRLLRALSLNIEGTVTWQYDQISLRARPVSDDELVLNPTQLPTDLVYGLKLGLSWSIGSVHNTIVNPRFGRVDLQDE